MRVEPAVDFGYAEPSQERPGDRVLLDEADPGGLVTQAGRRVRTFVALKPSIQSVGHGAACGWAAFSDGRHGTYRKQK